MAGIVQLIGRVMLSLIFIMAGLGKIFDLAGTSAYMESMHVPSELIWPAIALEVIGGIAIAIGYKTSLAAFALALFSVGTAVLFHHDLANQMQLILFMKNIAMAGGLLLLSVSGTTAYSLDRKKKNANFFATRQ